MEHLLNVKEAAEFLNVSEMTIRRWTNTGLLDCYRVGGRRARRFTISDLTAFLESESAKSPHAGVALGPRGLAAPGGAHITHLSAGENESSEIAVSYISRGLQDGETVCIVASDDKTRGILNALGHKGEMVEKRRASGQLNLSQGAETPEEQTRRLLGLVENNDRGIRVFGDMTWTKDKGWRMADLERLEKALNQSSLPGRCLFLCQYALDHFTGREIMMAMETHTHRLYHGQIKETLYRCPCPQGSFWIETP